MWPRLPKIDDPVFTEHIRLADWALRIGGVLSIRVAAVGSRVTAPADSVRQDSDYDILMFVKRPDLLEAAEALHKSGYVTDSSAYAAQEHTFTSWRFGGVNVLLTSDADFVNKFLIGTELAQRFKLRNRADRIALFQAIRGEYCYGETLIDPQA